VLNGLSSTRGLQNLKSKLPRRFPTCYSSGNLCVILFCLDGERLGTIPGP